MPKATTGSARPALRRNQVCIYRSVPSFRLAFNLFPLGMSLLQKEETCEPYQLLHEPYTLLNSLSLRNVMQLVLIVGHA